MDKENHSVRAPAAVVERRLAAILSMDVEGFSRLMEDDEEALLSKDQREVERIVLGLRKAGLK